MNLQRWAGIAFANMFSIGAIFFCYPDFLDLSGPDHSPVWVGLSFFALSFPLILLVPLAPEAILVLPVLNSLVWAAFWEWILSRFVDPPSVSRGESGASRSGAGGVRVEPGGPPGRGNLPTPPVGRFPAASFLRGPMRRYWWLVGFNYLTCAALAVLALFGSSFSRLIPGLDWWHVALLLPTSFPLVSLVLLFDPQSDASSLLFVNAFLWAGLVEGALRKFYDRPEHSDRG